MRLHALIFDLDGTLGDTLPVCYAAYREVLLKYLARDFSDQAIQKLFGPSEEGIFRKLVPDDWLAAQQAYLSAYQRLHPQLGRKIAGIEPLLESLRRNRIRTAVVTGKGSESARLSLEALGLTAYFDVVEAGSAQGAAKPQAIRTILQRWDLAPDEAAYVGDSVYDIRAARQAGVLALAAAWTPGAPLEQLRAAAPDALFQQVDDLRRWLAAATTEGSV